MSRTNLMFSPIAFALGACFARWSIIEDVPAAAAAPVEPVAPTEPVTGDQADAAAAQDAKEADASDEAPATVAVDVPAEHVSLIKRITAALERGEQWVADNIHAGVTQLENIFKDTDARQAEAGDEQ